MSVTPVSVLEPVSSGEFQALDLDRAHEVDRRHAMLAEYLALRNLDALLLTRPENFAWLSGGGDSTRRGPGDAVATLFITPEARLVLCSSADSGQLFDRELSGLGFQLKERPWTEDRNILVRDLCRGRTIASDDVGTSLHQDLADFRMLLAERDVAALRSLAVELTHAVEATARQCQRGETEAEVAGQIAHRMMKRNIVPVTIQVLADGQGRRYRHWAYSDDHIERFAVLTAIGRRNGLHCGVSRTLCFSSPPQQLIEWHQHAALIQATGMYFSHPGWEFLETWSRMARIYEKFGAADEWRAAEQAEVIGYDACEAAIVPGSSRRFVAGSAVFWHPSVRSTVAGDTMLVRPQGLEVLTIGENWPMLPILVKGELLPRPAILCREAAPRQWPPDEDGGMTGL
ncbi:MAG: aminopeptidase P family N-terminal domain-containing protein [Planctomyces sp.]|nr:aminopeptidase P family N-terminal domain-containing protein [Planctomyces sp.]